MNRLGLAILSVAILLAVPNLARAAGPTALEEAFVDAVGSCGPSSSAGGALGKNQDPAVQAALRNAEIIEAADAAAGVPGSMSALQECMQKALSGRGYTKAEMSVLPECAKQDWPSPLTSLGNCVHNRARMVK